MKKDAGFSLSHTYTLASLTRCNLDYTKITGKIAPEFYSSWFLMIVFITLGIFATNFIYSLVFFFYSLYPDVILTWLLSLLGIVFIYNIPHFLILLLLKYSSHDSKIPQILMLPYWLLIRKKYLSKQITLTITPKTLIISVLIGQKNQPISSILSLDSLQKVFITSHTLIFIFDPEYPRKTLFFSLKKTKPAVIKKIIGIFQKQKIKIHVINNL